MTRFLVDEQLPPTLAIQLRADGHEAVHIIEIGLAGGADARVWAEAARRGAVLVTKDADFTVHAFAGKSAPAILWIRLGNVTNRVLWAALKPRLPEIVAAFEAGEALVEVI